MIAAITKEEVLQINFDKESENGNIEYKWRLINISPERQVHLTTQMKYRLDEGFGEAIYEIGVEDDGNLLGLNKDDLVESIRTLNNICGNLNAELKILRIIKGKEGRIAEVMIKKHLPQELRLSLRIIMLGDTNVGKSTLIGVLVNGIKDDGKGKARMNVFKYKHEVYQGTTSSLTHQILAFNAEGKIITQSVLGILDWNEIVHSSNKFINFIDVSGQKKYSKTMLSGICGNEPDYALIIVDATQGLTATGKEYIKMATTMQVPFIIVITKADMAEEMQLLLTRYDIQNMLSDPSIKKYCVSLEGLDDVILFSKNMKENIAPIIEISNVTGKNLDLFSSFLNMLPPLENRWIDLTEQQSEFHISDLYIVNKEVVFGGIVYRGKIRNHQQLLLGPDNKGKFRKVEVKSIKCLKVFVQNVVAGQICSIAVNFGKDSEKFFNKINSQFRKGIVMVQPSLNPMACRKFEAELVTLDGKVRAIGSNYEPLIYTDHIRQTARIIIDKMTAAQESELKSNVEAPISIKTPIDEKAKEIILTEEMKKLSVANEEKKEVTPKVNGEEVKCQQINITPDKKTKLILQFMYYPEYIAIGHKVVIHDANLQAIGKITKVFFDETP